MNRIRLPNGLEISANTSFEAAVLYRQIFVLADEEDHGVRLSDGACVFDVGANVGMYSIRLARQHAGLRIHAFEPIPATHAILERNAREHLGGHEVHLHRHALGAEAGEATFHVDPFSAVTASMRPADLQRAARPDATPREWLLAFVNEMEKLGRLSERRARWTRSMLATPAGRWPILGLAGLAFAALLARGRLFRRRVRCTVRTLSQALHDAGVDSVDLLKIDVEGAEMEVLRGIETEDWPRIRQLGIEVRDVDGRLGEVMAMLRGHGYRVSVASQDSEIDYLLGVSTIYATRR